MGRPRGSTVSSSSDVTGKVDAKSKQIVRSSTRERKELMSTYAEDSHSESDQEERDEDPGSDFKESLSESVSEPESSGSEYGVKKKKVSKVTPKKAVGRGRGKKASPKGRKPKASPAKAKGRPGRKPKAGASPSKKADRPQRNTSKRLKYKERSDSEDEESPVLTDESEEPEEAISDSEEQFDSGSDSARKGRKRKAPQEKPKGRAGPAKRAAADVSAKNGKKKVKDESEEEEEEELEELEEKKPVKAKEVKNDVGKKSEPPAAAAASSESDANGEGESAEEDVVKAETPEKKPAATEEKPTKKAEEEDMDVEDAVEEESVKSKSDDGEKVLKNATETDYSTLSFECDKKSPKGEAPNLRLACWNVGGIKSWVKKNGLQYLEKENPDVLCLQEIRSSEKTQPAEVSKIENYPYTYWSFAEAAGHHGVGIISKVKPENVTYGLPIKDDDSEEDKKLKKSFNTEGRLIVAEYEKFILINAYVPNSGKGVKEGNMTKPYPMKVVNKERIHWDRILRTYLKELDAKKPIIVAGDLNVAHEEIDIANPKTNVNNAGFTKEEREDFTELLKETKLIDSFRSLYPDQKGAYSFWSYKFNNRQRNVGWRLDYFLISEKLKDSLVESNMRTKVLGSDHCPLVLFLHI